MERFVKGDIVVLPFPFSDLSATKRRPALIIADLTGDDLILCQITSIERKDEYSIILESKNFKQEKLDKPSSIKPNKLFSADRSIISYKIGSLKENKIKEVEDSIIKIIKK